MDEIYLVTVEDWTRNEVENYAFAEKEDALKEFYRLWREILGEDATDEYIDGVAEDRAEYDGDEFVTWEVLHVK